MLQLSLHDLSPFPFAFAQNGAARACSRYSCGVYTSGIQNECSSGPCVYVFVVYPLQVYSMGYHPRHFGFPLLVSLLF